MRLKQRFSGQIMVVALLVLTILGVIVVGLVGLANRDVVQTTSNREKEENFNAAETSVLALMERYGDTSVNLSGTVSNFSTELFSTATCTGASSIQATCNMTTLDGILSTISISDTAVVNDYTLGKDESLELNLQINGTTSYTGVITFSTSTVVALEFGLLYDLSGNLGYISDVFDLAGAYTSNGGSPLNTASPNHPFNFQQVGTNYTFSVSGIDGLPVGSRPLVLRVVARMPTDAITTLDLSGDATLPVQIRQFTVQSYNPNGELQIASRLNTAVPILPQLPPGFYNALNTEGEVSK